MKKRTIDEMWESAKKALRNDCENSIKQGVTTIDIMPERIILLLDEIERLNEAYDLEQELFQHKLLAIIYSLTLDENLGDVKDTMETILKHTGLELKNNPAYEEERTGFYNELADMGVKSLYGSTIERSEDG